MEQACVMFVSKRLMAMIIFKLMENVLCGLLRFKQVESSKDQFMRFIHNINNKTKKLEFSYLLGLGSASSRASA